MNHTLAAIFRIVTLNRIAGSILAFLALLITVVRVRDAWGFAPINVDAGCFLSIADRIVEGWAPYHQLKFGYTPLAIFILAGVRASFVAVEPSYFVYIGTVLAVEALTSAFIYLCCRIFTRSVPISLLAALMFMLGTLMHEGAAIVLEPFVTAFSTAALLILISRCPPQDSPEAKPPPSGEAVRPFDSPLMLFIAGALIGGAFLTKQYGVLGLGALASAILFYPGRVVERIKSVVWCGSGALAALFFFLGASSLAFGVSPIAVASDAWVPGYYRGVPPFDWILQFIYPRNPYLLLVPLLYFFRSYRRDPVFLLLTMFLIWSAVPCVIRGFAHYCILFMPYAVMLGAYLVSRFERSQFLVVRLCSTAVLFAMMPMARELNSMQLSEATQPDRAAQYEIVKQVHQQWPAGTRTVVFAHPWLTYAAQFDPMHSPRGSYAFVSNYKAEELRLILHKTGKLLIDLESVGYFEPERKKIEEAFGPLDEFLRREGFCLEHVERGRFQYWNLSCSEKVISAEPGTETPPT